MTTQLSKTQIDRLGDRLRKGSLTETDLKVLDDYRRSFGPAYETVVQTIRERTQLEPTGRPAKSTGALIEKLHRESIRLAQVQDIAGCRVIVPHIQAQERVVASLRKVFPQCSVVDRRERPSYGYRAVHIVLRVHGVLVEIQIRSSLQHLWAELSEKFSDVQDPAIKYGGGPPTTQNLLARLSSVISAFETLEVRNSVLTSQLAKVRRQLAKQAKEIAALPAKKRRELTGDSKYIDKRKRLEEVLAQREHLAATVRKAQLEMRPALQGMLNQLIIVAHGSKRPAE